MFFSKKTWNVLKRFFFFNSPPPPLEGLGKSWYLDTVSFEEPLYKKSAGQKEEKKVVEIAVNFRRCQSTAWMAIDCNDDARSKNLVARLTTRKRLHAHFFPNPQNCSSSCDDFHANKQQWDIFETLMKHPKKFKFPPWALLPPPADNFLRAFQYFIARILWIGP